jgi:hypothetical protein
VPADSAASWRRSGEKAPLRRRRRRTGAVTDGRIDRTSVWYQMRVCSRAVGSGGVPALLRHEERGRVVEDVSRELLLLSEARRVLGCTQSTRAARARRIPERRAGVIPCPRGSRGRRVPDQTERSRGTSQRASRSPRRLRRCSRALCARSRADRGRPSDPGSVSRDSEEKRCRSTMRGPAPGTIPRWRTGATRCGSNRGGQRSISP